MRTITKTVYQFSELDESAKDRARDWFREGNLDYEWWDSVYDSAVTAADIIGIELDTRSEKLMNGTTVQKPQIYFSGFYSQGDGASFTGRYDYKAGSCKAIRAEFGDPELHRITDGLRDIQCKHFYKLSCRITQSGNYSHSRTMSVETLWDYDYCHDESPSLEVQYEMEQLIRDFADWIYRSLEKEYEYLQSDECIDESITCNEYEFTEDGERV